MDLEEFLDSRIRIQVNSINPIIEDLDEDLDTFTVGTLIAEANNDTQNVKADDIFGTKYKHVLNENIFNAFRSKYGEDMDIEFRFGEISGKKKVHILTLLRPVIATGLLTKEKSIFNLTNKRQPIYNIFNKLIKKDKMDKTVVATSKLIPLLFSMREDYVIPSLKNHKRRYIREYKAKAVAGDLDESIIGDKIKEVRSNDAELEKLIKRNVNYSVEHVLPVIIFRIRKTIFEEGGELNLKIPSEKTQEFFDGLVETVYKKYIDIKLKGLPTSLTTIVRDKTFYSYGEEYYTAAKSMINFEETDYIQENGHVFD